MNFKMKAAVAALALTASMSASAAMTNNQSGASSLVLTLIDNTNNISATFDLGFSHASFDRNSNSFWNLASGDYADAWSTYWATATVADTQWAVASGDNTGTGAGVRSLFTTKADTTVNVIKTTDFGTAMGNFDAYLNAHTSLGNHASVANGASTATAGNGFAEFTGAYGTNGFYAAKIGDTTGAMDSNMMVWTVNSAASGLTATTQGQYKTAGFSNYFNMSSNGQLSYVAAVPEADTWAMLLAGLGLMGFIARRRTTA